MSSAKPSMYLVTTSLLSRCSWYVSLNGFIFFDVLIFISRISMHSIKSRLSIESPCLHPLPMLIDFEMFPVCTISTLKSFRRVIIQFISLVLNPKNFRTAFMKAKEIESKTFQKSMASITPLLLLLFA